MEITQLPTDKSTQQRLLVVHTADQQPFHLASVLFGTRRGEPGAERFLWKAWNSIDIIMNEYIYMHSEFIMVPMNHISHIISARYNIYICTHRHLISYTTY